MNQNLKIFITLILIIATILVAYYGSYLPFSKSRAFISSMRTLGQTASLDSFKKTFSFPLDIPSPVGQEELVRQLGNISLNVVQQNNNPKAIEDLVSYLESYYRPIVERNKGMSFSQDLYVLGSVNELAFLKTSNKAFFDASKKYFERAVEYGPKRPQALYGIFDIYRLEGNVNGAKAVADQILSQWPNDDKTRSIITEFLKKAATKNLPKSSSTTR